MTVKTYTYSPLATLVSLAGPDYMWTASTGGHRKATRHPSTGENVRAGLKRFIAEYAGYRCVACGDAVALDAGEVAHIVSRGPNRRGFLPSNLFWSCSACNAQQKVAGPIVDISTLDLTRIPQEFPTDVELGHLA